MTRQLATSALWAAILLNLVAGGLLAAILIVMPTSLGPTELVEAGVEPWTIALYAAGGFVALVVVAILALFAWHSQRFKLAGLVLAAVQIGAVLWAGYEMYLEYF